MIARSLNLGVAILIAICSASQNIDDEACTASYYGKQFAGKKTSSGRVFNPNEYTCAHRTLPFGTKVEIINPENGKYVIATVTDRGPFIKGRCIDVSHRIARELGFEHKGITKVIINPLPKTPLWREVSSYDSVRMNNCYVIKVGAFETEEQAFKSALKLKKHCQTDIFLVKNDSLTKPYIILTGKFDSMQFAEDIFFDIPTEFSEKEVIEFNSINDYLD
ncbi:MAG: septal ring lytic transglycosylase RlpA family protein [Chitinophagales bacterium]|nr:septal ring lytic transglycosylase RlpA family protein [Chitinophagales bacterium]MDW8273095.1 septal ring lytic transglycosylase RlpA family protein [Chitinophagales bacterium]